jgi:type IV pilus assembly protein PilM
VLEAVCLRSREVTLIVPDAAVRVLLLEFDELPAKPAEALPIVRFRLKKLLPSTPTTRP